MHPELFHIGRLSVKWFGALLAVGFFAGLANWVWLSRKEGRDANFCADLLFWIMLSGILGARAAHILSEFRYYLKYPVEMVRVDLGGLIFYGGFIAAGIAIFVFARVRRVGFWALVDLVITSVPLAHVFGRIGCFMNGCCHGTAYAGPFSVTYPASSLPWDWQVRSGQISQLAPHALPVHPVQFYEAACNVVLYLLLVWVYRHRKRDGVVTALYLLTYPVARYYLEFLRGDERAMCCGLSVAQAVSIGFYLVGIAVLWTALRRRAKPETQGGIA